MSQFQEQIRQLLHECFPGATIWEEVPLMLEGRRYRVDFVLPHLGLAIEADGPQHEQFVPHFHRDVLGWHDAQRRDWDKTEAIADHAWTLVRIRWQEAHGLSKAWLLARIAAAEQEQEQEGNCGQAEQS